MKTKSLIIFLCIITIFENAYPQQTAWNYFKNYSNSQKHVIRRNWNQYFKDDIHKMLDSTVHMFPIKFDSYGALYPDARLLENFRTDIDFNPRARNPKNNLAFSMYDIFGADHNNTLTNALQKMDGRDKEFYTKMLRSNSGIISFYKDWNDFHFSRKIEELKETVKKRKCKSILFFVHGYNVPSSLATIQALELYRLVGKEGIDTSSMLLVPVYWPSNNAKHCVLDTEATFDISNKKNLKNGLASTFYANRAYFAAIGLRKLINGLSDETGVRLYLFSHSLGAVVVSSALVNTYSKLQTKFKTEKGNADSAREFLIDNKEKLAGSEHINFQILMGLVGEPIPKSPILVYMSAASMPGVTTFMDMDIEQMLNKVFYVPINYNDEMLNKDVGIKFSPGKLSSTTLGIDYLDEATVTQSIFKNREKFKVQVVSDNTDHDILIYMLQPGYRKFVWEFFNERSH